MEKTVKLSGENALTNLEVREMLIVLSTHSVGTDRESSLRRKLRAALKQAEGDGPKRLVAAKVSHHPRLKLVGGAE